MLQTVPQPRKLHVPAPRTGIGASWRVLVVDNDPVFCRGLRCILEEDLAAQVVVASTGAQAVSTTVRIRPDVLVLDVQTAAPCDRLAVLPTLARLTRVVVVACTAEPHLVARVIQQGAVGFLVHGEYTTGELLRAVVHGRRGRAVLSAPAAAAAARMLERRPPRTAPVSRSQLSGRETEVMDNIARGLSNQDIALALTLSEKTVKNYVNRIFAKLQVTTRAKAIVLWLAADDSRDLALSPTG